MQGGDRRPGADRAPVRREAELEATALVGGLGVQVHEPDGLLRRAAARPRDARHRTPRRRLRAVRAPRRPSPPPSRPTPRRTPPAPRSARRAPDSLTALAYATTRALEDVARTRHRRQPRRDQPAGARLGRAERPARAHGRDRARAPRRAARRVRTRTRRAARRAPARAPRPRRLGARIDEQVDVDLELARADRRLHPVPVAAGVGERLRHRRLARAVEAQHTASRAAGRAPAPAARGSVSSALGQSRCSSDGGPGRTTTAPWPVSSTIPGAVPARPSEIAPAGKVACLRTPGSKSAYGRGSAARRPCARRAPISSCSPSSSTSSRPAAFATSSTVRSSCVGPSPPETRHRSARRPSARAASISSGRSPTIVILAGSRPSSERLGGEKRAVQVGALAADELAAGDDDRGPRPRRR